MSEANPNSAVMASNGLRNEKNHSVNFQSTKHSREIDSELHLRHIAPNVPPNPVRYFVQHGGHRGPDFVPHRDHLPLWQQIPRRGIVDEGQNPQRMSKSGQILGADVGIFCAQLGPRLHRKLVVLRQRTALVHGQRPACSVPAVLVQLVLPAVQKLPQLGGTCRIGQLFARQIVLPVVGPGLLPVGFRGRLV